jgi:hypothetical protein
MSSDVSQLLSTRMVNMRMVIIMINMTQDDQGNLISPTDNKKVFQLFQQKDYIDVSFRKIRLCPIENLE